MYDVFSDEDDDGEDEDEDEEGATRGPGRLVHRASQMGVGRAARKVKVEFEGQVSSNQLLLKFYRRCFEPRGLARVRVGLRLTRQT